MKKRISVALFVFYLVVLGSYLGLEIDTYVEDLPFFQTYTLILFINVLFALILPPLLYALFASIQSLWSRRSFRIIFLILNSLYFHLVVLLLLYKAVRDMDFDFYFFWYNLTVALSVLWRLFAPWLVVLLVSVLAFTLFQQWFFAPVLALLKKNRRKTATVITAVVVGSMLCQAFTLGTIRGSAAGFLYASFLSDRHLRTEYSELYEKHIESLQKAQPTNTDRATPSLLGEKVIFVQQESLNNLLLGSRITPQLLRASRDGILFDSMYGNSIQSERGYECILCGVPPSITRDLVEEYSKEELTKLPCLPRIFKKFGYRPIVFYSGNPNPRVMRLFESIGFEQILSSDIMQPGDVMYDWGYREDIFFTRVDEYLQEHAAREKLFIFITASATNHTPFHILDERYLDKAPYPNPQTFEEHLSNTTFVQDAYFGVLYDIYKKHYAENSTLIAVSDHAWPLGRHKNNIFNERGAFEENFRIALLMLPPLSRKGDFAAGTVVSHRFSQMDIVPSLLDLIGLKYDDGPAESFAPWLLTGRAADRLPPRKTKISVQPYGGGYISAIRYPKKYLFNVLGDNVQIYDLETDPEESNPVTADVVEHMGLICDFFDPSPEPIK